MSCPDVSGVMRKASFKGASFHVDSSTENYGRRVVVHEFPMRDIPYNEDLGAKAIKVQITGYLTGEGWLSARDALISACTSFGPGPLSHPFYGSTIFANCTACNVSESKNELGRVKVSLEFVEVLSWTGGGGLPSLPYLALRCERSVNEVVRQSVNSFRSATPNELSDRESLAIVEEIQNGAILLDEARMLCLLDSNEAPNLKSSIRDLHANAERIGYGLDLTKNETLEEKMQNVVDDFRKAATDPSELTRVLRTPAEAAQDFVSITTGAGTVVSASDLRFRTKAMFRRIFGSLWGEACANTQYRTRREATEIQNAYSSWWGKEAGKISAGLNEDMYEIFDRCRARTTDLFVRNLTDLSPTIEVKYGRPMTAMAVAMRAYGDPSRAIEIWKASGSPHPSIVGPRLRIKSK